MRAIPFSRRGATNLRLYYSCGIVDAQPRIGNAMTVLLRFKAYPLTSHPPSGSRLYHMHKKVVLTVNISQFLIHVYTELLFCNFATNQEFADGHFVYLGGNMKRGLGSFSCNVCVTILAAKKSLKNQSIFFR